MTLTLNASISLIRMRCPISAVGS